jgi:hypothetical protein
MVKLTNVINKEQGDKVKEILEAIDTYMNIKVLVCPIGGSMDVWAETMYDCSEDDFKEFLLMVLTDALIGGRGEINNG